MAGRAARRRPRLPRERRQRRRAQPRRGGARPRRGAVERQRYEEALDEYDALATAVAHGRLELELRSLSRRGLGAHPAGEVRRRSSCSSALASSTEGAELLGHRPRGRALPPRRLPLQASSIATALGLLNEALTLADRSGLPCDLLRVGHPRLALPLLPPPARLGGGARGRRAGARARPRRSTTAARSRTRTSRPRSSPSGGALGARPHLRRAARGLLRGARRPRECRPAAEQPRRPELLLGKPEQAVEHLKAAFTVAIEWQRRGRRAGGSARSRRCTCTAAVRPGRGAGAPRAGAARRPGRLPARNRPTQLVLGRALLEQDRLDEAEKWLRAADRAPSSCRRSATGLRPGSHRAISTTRGTISGGRPAVPAGGRGAAGRPLLGRKEV